jgi:hypothetical protein
LVGGNPSDRADLKFAALAEATGAILVTMDRDFLSVRETLEIAIMTPYEFADDDQRCWANSIRPSSRNSRAGTLVIAKSRGDCLLPCTMIEPD